MNSGRGKIVSGLLEPILGGNLRGKGPRWAMGELCIAFSDLVETLTSRPRAIRPRSVWRNPLRTHTGTCQLRKTKSTGMPCEIQR